MKLTEDRIRFIRDNASTILLDQDTLKELCRLALTLHDIALFLPKEIQDEDDRYPGENRFASCRGCERVLLPGNRTVADGCPCNSPRGVNHGLVAKNTCTCEICDPEQTGSTRITPLSRLMMMVERLG